jgi:GT2 family glycosyltransferase
MPSEIADRPKVSVVIVNYNTREMTLECLRTLTENLGQDQIQAEIIVVDNASSDGSIEAIRNAFPQITVIASPTNRGFGAANNLAMKQATGDYFLLLNTDAFPEPKAISSLVAYLENHPHVGVVGPRLLNGDGSLQTSCYPFPTPGRAWAENLWLSAAFPRSALVGDYRHWGHDEEREVEWAIGACLLVRKKVVEEVGGFDETFFMYSEEADWQRRIRNAGWTIAFTPAAVVTHLGGASGKTEKAKINRHFFESLDYYERKHHGLMGLMLLRMAMIIGCSMRACLWIVAAILPGRRARALSKVKLHAWLIARQAAFWRIPPSAKVTT